MKRHSTHTLQHNYTLQTYPLLLNTHNSHNTDDVTITTTHNNIHTDTRNDSLFTPDPTVYNTRLALHMSNTTLDMHTHSKIMGLILDPHATNTLIVLQPNIYSLSAFYPPVHDHNI